MKRITLLAVVALMVAVVVPVMATDFTWSGELTYGSITDGTNVSDAYGNAQLTVTAAADANNVLTARFNTAYKGAGITTLTDLTGGTSTINAFSAYLGRLYFTSDVGKVLGLSGVTAVATFGWYDATAASNSLTGFGYESVMGYDPGWRDAAQVVVGFGAPFSLKVAMSPMDSTKSLEAFQPQFLVNATGAFGPVSYSVAYWSNSTTTYMGEMGASVNFSQAFGDLTPSVNAEVNYDLTAATYQIGAGVTVAYTSMVTVGFGTVIDAAGLGNTSIELNLVPMKDLGVDVAASLDLTTGAASLINGIDASATYMLGKSKVRVGYLYTTVGAGDLNAPATLTNGGVYFSWDLTF